MDLLTFFILLLLIAWLLGKTYLATQLIHLLLAIAILLILVQLVSKIPRNGGNE